MEELLTGLGGGGIGLGAIIWYAKTRFIKFDKKISDMKKEIQQSTSDNDLQKEQISKLKEENKDIRQQLRDLRR